MMPITARLMIAGANSSVASGKRGRQKRRKP
jgi:hypothetical protein